MREITLIGTYGLSEDQLEIIKANIPTKKCEVMETESFSDIVACSEMAIVVIWDKLTVDEANRLMWELVKLGAENSYTTNIFDNAISVRRVTLPCGAHFAGIGKIL